MYTVNVLFLYGGNTVANKGSSGIYFAQFVVKEERPRHPSTSILGAWLAYRRAAAVVEWMAWRVLPWG